MFKDEHKQSVWNTLRQHDLQPLRGLLPDSLVESAAVLAGLRKRSGPLNIVSLVWLAMLSAVERGRNFANVLQLTLKLLHDAQRWEGTASPSLLPARRQKGKKAKGKSKHDPHGSDPNLVSEEAFVQARKHIPRTFWVGLILLLGRCFDRKHGRLLRFGKYRLLALDGTTLDLPGRKNLLEHFGANANQYGCGKRGAARMVMLQFPLTRLPWRYQLAPLNQGERTLAAGLLDQLEVDDLVLMDRGFFSYGLFWRVQKRSAFFAIRLMSGVKLKQVRHLGHKDRLVRWRPADRKQWKDCPDSIDLRVIDYQIKGFRPSAIVTNVTDPRAISRQQWVRLSTASEPGRRLDPGLYHRRWEIETTFFELKVEQGMEGSLRGRTIECIEYEVAGHVLLYMLVRWLMVEAALTSGQDPLRLSFLEALRELDDLRPALLAADVKQVAEYLIPLLLERIASHIVPWRPGRYDSRPGDRQVKYKGKGKYRQPSKLAAIET